MKTLKKILKYFALFIGVFLLWMIINAIRIHAYSDSYSETSSDVAIVLGAGTSNGKISPVYRERANHGINLLKQGKVKALIFTGGFGKGQKQSDSKVAMLYALNKGVPKDEIYIEEKSTITFTNLRHAKQILDSCNFQAALIVSDPYHMKRSMAMCNKLGINAKPSPTPTSMYRSTETKIKSLIYEAFFYNLGVVQGYIRI